MPNTVLIIYHQLVEQIDNANSEWSSYIFIALSFNFCIDLDKLKMWEPLQELLTSPASSDEIKTQTLWVVGTAVQNNPSAQTSVRH